MTFAGATPSCRVLRDGLNSTSLRLALRDGGAEPIQVLVEGHPAPLSPGQAREFPIGRQH